MHQPNLVTSLETIELSAHPRLYHRRSLASIIEIDDYTTNSYADIGRQTIVRWQDFYFIQRGGAVGFWPILNGNRGRPLQWHRLDRDSRSSVRIDIRYRYPARRHAPPSDNEKFGIANFPFNF